jgi:hypothetical protein
VVDLWLMLVMWVWLFDIALSALIGAARFDLGFYAGRLFGLFAASFLFLTLLVEMMQMHAGAADQPAPPHHEGAGAFVPRQNVLRYRSLLESGSLDEAQRRSIEQLLAEAESRRETD